MPFTAAFSVAVGTALARAIAALRRAPLKVVVADCDNTLWAGECGEDGSDRVVVTPAFAAVQRRTRAAAPAGPPLRCRYAL